MKIIELLGRDAGTKECSKCMIFLPISSFWKDKNRKDLLQTYCISCCKLTNSPYMIRYKTKQKIYQKKFHMNNKDKVNKIQRDRWAQDRLDCLNHYGGKCQCCNEDKYEFLAIDHIEGGGNKHRSETGGKIVRWLKKNNYPNGFRVLCHNCNHSLGMHGYCPHEK